MPCFSCADGDCRLNIDVGLSLRCLHNIQASADKDHKLDDLKKNRLKLNSLKKDVVFFRKNLKKALKETQPCPICLGSVKAGFAAITQCGHIFCLSCIKRWTDTNERCPNCNDHLDSDTGWEMAAALPASVSGSTGAAFANKGTAHAANPHIARALSKYGSKIASVMMKLEDIRRKDPAAKCVLYCQFSSLRIVLKEAFEELQIKFLPLQGNPEQIRNILGEFQDVQSEKWLLLCSMDTQAAGTNLQVANHVVFVHPLYAENRDQVGAWEAQAIGRLYRPGQENVVEIHRLVTGDTIEREMHETARGDETTPPLWTQHFAL